MQSKRYITQKHAKFAQYNFIIAQYASSYLMVTMQKYKRLLPFSFREVNSLSGSSPTNAEKQITFANYINNGGFPESWVKNLDSGNYPGSLFDSVLFKDIVKRYNIRFPVLLDNLSKFLISNISTEFTLKSLTKAVNAKRDHTIEKYYGYLEEAFLFFKVPRFSF